MARERILGIFESSHEQVATPCDCHSTMDILQHKEGHEDLQRLTKYGQKVNKCTVSSNDVTTHRSLLVHISHPSQGAKAQKEFQKA
ncbi:hypothetical protein PABG_11627 [Paracoccidioides brasiliensis Pb03]|nr:hypothetical protein PABG_11627 [Paracoccidioides brasiliensis Pb03]